MAQVINEPANWPNLNWTIGGSYAESGLVANPTVDASFTYDDDAAGSSAVNNINAESPVFDLTPAFAASEFNIIFTLDYVHYNTGGSLTLDYWDAD